MDEKELDNVAAFDLLFTTNQIQILKAIFPFFPLYMQKYLAIFIKYQTRSFAFKNVNALTYLLKVITF